MDDDIFSSSDSWIEQELFENFRVWHVMAIVLGTALAFGKGIAGYKIRSDCTFTTIFQ